MRVLTLAASVALCIAAGQAAAQATAKETAPAKTRPALTVSLATAQTTRLARTLTAHGSVAAWQEASISAELSGLRITELRADAGDTVAAGQVLALLASDTIQADLALAQATLQEAQASAADAAAQAARGRSLQGSGVLSEQQIQQLQTAEQASQARLAQAQAQLGLQQLRLRQTQVVAPDAGTISARNATIGAVVGTGNELFRLIRQGRLEWRAELPSAELQRVRVGQVVRLTSAESASQQGRVRRIAPTVDPQSRTGLVYVDLSSKDTGLRAGMFAKGEFQLAAQDEAATVPQQAVVVRDGFSHVFVFQGEGGQADQGRVQQLLIKTGRRSGEQVEVLEGLPAGARVVSRGAGFLNDGDLVKVAPGPQR